MNLRLFLRVRTNFVADSIKKNDGKARDGLRETAPPSRGKLREGSREGGKARETKIPASTVSQTVQFNSEYSAGSINALSGYIAINAARAAEYM